MTFLKRRFLTPPDAGFTLVEVIVAMMIFTIIALGVSYSLVSTMTQVGDARAREIATNLAAKEIDIARSVKDVMTLLDVVRPTTTVDGQNFAVQRSSRWISDPSSSGVCGVTASGSGGELAYKNIKVTVSWPSAVGGTRSVSAETLIAPTSRVSSASTGTIIILVKNVQGKGSPGIAVSITPTPATPPPVTDAEGCIYLNNVTPGVYTIKVTSPGYIDTSQVLNPSRTVSVVAGKSAGIAPQVEPKKPLQLRFPTGLIPTNLTTSLLHSSDPAFLTPPNTSTLDVYPFVEGYKGVAGQFVASNEGTPGCLSPNPGSWLDGMRGADRVSSAPLGTTFAGPGARIDVGMGSVGFTSASVATRVTAVSEAAGPAGSGDPGCGGLTMTYQFTTGMTLGTSVSLLLPYGSWKLYYGTTPTPAGLVTTGLTASTVTGSVVTVDPRVVTP